MIINIFIKFSLNLIESEEQKTMQIIYTKDKIKIQIINKLIRIKTCIQIKLKLTNFINKELIKTSSQLIKLIILITTNKAKFKHNKNMSFTHQIISTDQN